MEIRGPRNYRNDKVATAGRAQGVQGWQLRIDGADPRLALIGRVLMLRGVSTREKSSAFLERN